MSGIESILVVIFIYAIVTCWVVDIDTKPEISFVAWGVALVAWALFTFL